MQHFVQQQLVLHSYSVIQVIYKGEDTVCRGYVPLTYVPHTIPGVCILLPLFEVLCIL